MHRTAVSAVFLVMSFFAGGTVWPDTTATAQEQSMKITQLSAIRNDTCMGELAYKPIDGVGERPLCVGATPAAAAHFTSGTARPLAFRLAFDPMFYEVTNVCRSGGCVYAPDTDVLWEQRLDGGINYSLHRYDSISRYMSPIFNAAGARWQYEYNGPTPVHVYSGINSFGVSENGQWIGVEVRSKGVLLIRSQDGAMRRVTSLLHQYGRGYDPSYHIAVQNDGKRVFVGGQNVSPALIEVTDMCGEPVVVGLALNDRFTAPQSACPIDILSFAPTLSVYRYSHHPRFDDDSGSLFVRVRSVADQDFLVQRQFATPLERRLAYVALGDSFTSGEGETDDGRYLPGTNGNGNRCHVSGRSYPFLLIRSPLPMSSEACSGATTAHLLASNGALPPQLSRVRVHQPDLVTTSIGGNDFDLVGKLASCAGPGTCLWAQPDRRSLTAREAMQLYDRLVDVFTEIRKSAPQARHIIVGYPLAIDPDGRCDAVTSLLLNDAERTYLFEAQRLLNRTIAAAAHRVSLEFADIADAYASHRLCSGTQTLAMNSLRLGNDVAPIPGFPHLKVIGNESFHPTPFGHQLVAPLIDQFIADPPAPLCVSEVCHNLFPPDETYWAHPQDSPFVYRLEQQRLDNGDVVISSSGLFANNSSVSGSLFSEEIALGSVASNSSGEVTFQIASELLGTETHTVLLSGTNQRGEEILGYAIIRATATYDNQAIPQGSVISGTDAALPEATPEVPPQLSQTVNTSRNAPQEVQGENASVLGVSDAATPPRAPVPPFEPSLNPWLAPIFATIGLSLGIIALWLYFVRS